MKNSEITQEQAGSEEKPSRRSCRRWKYLISAVLVPISIAAALLFVWFNQEPKPDPVSEAIFRKAASKIIPKKPNELTKNDFAQIKEFDIELSRDVEVRYFGPRPIKIVTYELSDIQLLAKFRNLQKLSLISLKVPDSKTPKWMKILAKLGVYNLDRKYTIDLSPLKKLDHLEELHIGGPAIEDLTPLAGLNLKYMQLVNASTSDIKQIMNFKKLENLDIVFCPNIKKKDVEDLKKARPNLNIEFSYIK